LKINKNQELQKKNINANAEKGSLLSIIGFVVIKADDQSKINMKGKILTISGFIEHLIFKSSN
jgi:hypothetical protein